MYDGMVDTSGLIMWSRKDETRSMGPLQPLTMGLIPCSLRSSDLSFSSPKNPVRERV